MAINATEYGSLEEKQKTVARIRKKLQHPGCGVAISAGTDHTVLLYPRGTVAACGSNLKGALNVSEWRDIVAVCAGYNHTALLRANGRVEIIGDNTRCKCALSGRQLFTDESELDRNIEQWTKRKTEQLDSEEAALRTELDGLKGLFSVIRRRQIEKEIAKLGEQRQKHETMLAEVNAD